MSETVSIYKLGIYGKAYDVPGTCRAYTYKHQPDNQGAWRLGEARIMASLTCGGDYIDAGLGLLKQLELKGYGVYELEEAGAPEERPDLIRFDFINADGKSDSKMITHDDMRERYAALAGQGERQKPVGYVAAQDLIRLITPGCTGFSAMLWPSGSERTIPFYTAPQPAQVGRIPAGLYAELDALRTLRDATGVYLQGYMRDEIEDEESCSADQHDSACTVKLALDKARALEWKGGDK